MPIIIDPGSAGGLRDDKCGQGGSRGASAAASRLMSSALAHSEPVEWAAVRKSVVSIAAYQRLRRRPATGQWALAVG
eukprot:8423061-Lingulodinium_polyedra.AAC.1